MSEAGPWIYPRPVSERRDWIYHFEGNTLSHLEIITYPNVLNNLQEPSSKIITREEMDPIFVKNREAIQCLEPFPLKR